MNTISHEFYLVVKSIIRSPLAWILVILSEILILSNSTTVSWFIKLLPLATVILSLVGQTLTNYFHNYLLHKWANENQ